MPDTPDHETIERVLHTEPVKILERLPNNVERRRAEEHIKIAVDYAMQSREKHADRS